MLSKKYSLSRKKSFSKKNSIKRKSIKRKSIKRKSTYRRKLSKNKSRNRRMKYRGGSNQRMIPERPVVGDGFPYTPSQRTELKNMKNRQPPDFSGTVDKRKQKMTEFLEQKQKNIASYLWWYIGLQNS